MVLLNILLHAIVTCLRLVWKFVFLAHTEFWAGIITVPFMFFLLFTNIMDDVEEYCYTYVVELKVRPALSNPPTYSPSPVCFQKPFYAAHGLAHLLEHKLTGRRQSYMVSFFDAVVLGSDGTSGNYCLPKVIEENWRYLALEVIRAKLACNMYQNKQGHILRIPRSGRSFVLKFEFNISQKFLMKMRCVGYLAPDFYLYQALKFASIWIEYDEEEFDLMVHENELCSMGSDAKGGDLTPVSSRDVSPPPMFHTYSDITLLDSRSSQATKCESEERSVKICVYAGVRFAAIDDVHIVSLKEPVCPTGKPSVWGRIRMSTVNKGRPWLPARYIGQTGRRLIPAQMGISTSELVSPLPESNSSLMTRIRGPTKHKASLSSRFVGVDLSSAGAPKVSLIKIKRKAMNAMGKFGHPMKTTSTM
jgi:hypothetical protein